MRISDWSSDVCSSDLTAGSLCFSFRLAIEGWCALQRAVGFPRNTGGILHPMLVGFGIAAGGAGFGQHVQVSLLQALLDFRKLKIGRASCRERGCKYVWISVVAVSLKKKQVE